MIAARKITKTSNIYCFMVIFRGINSSVRGKCRGGTKQKNTKNYRGSTIWCYLGNISCVF